MNLLQSIPPQSPFCVTLNLTERIDPARIIDTFHYDHPVYTHASVAAQQRVAEISGEHRTHYCGAYWGNGFHEDGVVSGERVAAEIGRSTSSLASA